MAQVRHHGNLGVEWNRQNFLDLLQDWKGRGHRGGWGDGSQAGETVGQGIHIDVQLGVVEIFLSITLIQVSLPPGEREQRALSILKEKTTVEEEAFAGNSRDYHLRHGTSTYGGAKEKKRHP